MTHSYYKFLLAYVTATFGSTEMVFNIQELTQICIPYILMDDYMKMPGSIGKLK